jgi:hypothetical protein
MRCGWVPGPRWGPVLVCLISVTSALADGQGALAYLAGGQSPAGPLSSPVRHYSGSRAEGAPHRAAWQPSSERRVTPRPGARLRPQHALSAPERDVALVVPRVATGEVPPGGRRGVQGMLMA